MTKLLHCATVVTIASSSVSDTNVHARFKTQTCSTQQQIRRRYKWSKWSGAPVCASLASAVHTQDTTMLPMNATARGNNGMTPKWLAAHPGNSSWKVLLITVGHMPGDILLDFESINISSHIKEQVQFEVHFKCETVTILVFSCLSLPAVIQLSF